MSTHIQLLRRYGGLPAFLLGFSLLTPVFASSGSWVTKTPIPTKRYLFVSEMVNGKIYAIGGYNGGYFTTNEEYDPENDTWSTKASMSQAREGAASGVVNGKIYVIGGNTTSPKRNVEEYDPIANTWTSKTSLSMDLAQAASAVVNNKIYVIGGWGDAILNTVWEYDPAGDSWTAKAPMPTPRRWSDASVVDGQIYVIGGGDLTQAFSTVEAYDPVTNTWTTKASLPAARQGGFSAVVGGRIYYIGGGQFTGIVEEYDPATDTWTNCGGSCTTMPTGRTFLNGSTVNGRIYAISGQVPGGGYTMTNVVEEYTPPDWDSLSVGLVAFYPFNGNANDESGNGNDGTVYGATLTTDRFGNANRAYSFDGEDDYIDVGSAASLNLPGSPLTIEAWIKGNDITWAPYPVIFFSNENNGYGLGVIHPTGILQFTMVGVDAKYSDGSIKDTDWHQISIVYSASDSVYFYFDGVSDAGNPQYYPRTFSTSQTYLIGGRTYLGGNYFDGLIDDIRIYNRALSAAEIQALYHQGGWDIPPEIVSTSPAQNALNVAQDAAISVTFDVEMDPASFDNTTFVVHASQTGLVSGTCTLSSGDSTATFTPTNPFKVGELVSVTLTTGVQSAAGITLASPYTWAFTAEVAGGSGTFATAVNYGVGAYPYSVASADLDGDGDNDLVAHNGNSHNVSVLLNNGDGTFDDAVNYSVGSGPTFVTVADLDGDGDSDLAVTNGISGTVSVLLNNGNGSFAPAAHYSAGTAPWTVAAADLDGDGDRDLAAANSASNNLSVLFNDGDGTFATPIYYGLGSAPRSVTAADLDGDGDNDLAVTIEDDWNVSVLLNDGAGALANAVNYSVGSAPRSVTATDLDGDGDNDLAVANSAGANVSVLLNSGTGSYATAVNYSVGSTPYSVTAADLDGDGDSDLAVANFIGNNVSVLLNGGTGTFAEAVHYGVGSGSYGVAAADLDGDGDNDLAVANATSNNVSVLRNIWDSTPPAAPTGLTAIPGDGQVILYWDANSEMDFSYYVVYQSTTAGFIPTSADSVAMDLKPEPSVTITGLDNNTTYYYRVVAVDDAGNRSAASNEASATPTVGLAAHYPFNGNANDESGNGNDGTVYGATLAEDRFGNASSAYSFDGVDDYISIPTDASILNTPINQFSFQAWIKSISGDGTTSQNVFEMHTQAPSGNKEVYFEANLPAPMRFGITDNSGGDHQVSSQPLELDAWYQVVGTYDGSKQRIYIDSALHDSLEWSQNFTITSEALLGKDMEGGQQFNGIIDDVRIYDRALSAAEIQALYHEGGWDISPAIVATSPTPNALNVSRDAAISVTFDMEMDPASLDDTTFVVNASHTGLVSGTYSYDPGSYTATFTPDNLFKVGEQVSVTLTTGARSAAGSNLDSPYIWSFTIEVTEGSGEFAAAVHYSVGDQPLSVIAADFDGDGNSDLATANAWSGNLSVLLNDGLGSFAATANYGALEHPWSITAADLDGDGNADLAVTEWYSNNVSVFRNDGSGSFTATLNYNVGDYPESVIAVDLNGDGNIDLAVANAESDNVSVLLNNGLGIFAAAVNYGVGDQPRSITATDLDGDGDNDLAVANYNNANVSVLLNNGLGSYAAAVNYAVGNGPWFVTAADLNGDGDIDLVVANDQSDDVSVLLNDGSGGLTAVENYDVENAPCSVAAADFDDDGDTDLAVTNNYSDNVSVLLNDGLGGFTTAVNYSAGDDPFCITAADFDGDGDCDLAVANSDSNKVSVLLNTGGAPPVAGLLAWYPFNGNANDESGNGYDGTVDGATLAEDRFGNANCAYSFDGVDDVITGTLGATSGIETAITTTAWFYQPTAAGHPGKGIVGVGSGANKEHFYQRLFADYGDANWDGADGQNRLFIGADDGANDRWWGSNTVITTGEWHFVTTTYSSASREVRIYIDGDFDREVTLSDDLSLTADLFIGCDGHNDNHFEGRIDDIRIYNRVLSPAEIRALYNVGGWASGPDYFVFFNGMTLPPDISASTWCGSALEVETGAGAVPSTNAIKWSQDDECGTGFSGFHLNMRAAANLSGLFKDADTLRFLYKAESGVGDIIVQFETGVFPDAGVLGEVVAIVADDEWHAAEFCLADLSDRASGADGTQFDSTSVSRLAIFSNANAVTGLVVYFDNIWMGLPGNMLISTRFLTAGGEVAFPGTGVTGTFDFTSQTGMDTIEVKAFQVPPGGNLPADISLVMPRYWEINHWGTGVFSASLEFNLGTGAFNAGDQAYPARLKLLRRESATVTDWAVTAEGASASDSTVGFDNITGFSQFTIGRITDTQAPTISNVSAPSSATSGNAVTVTATVTDASDLQSVLLHYLVGGSSSYDQVGMSSLGADTYSGYIPSSAVTENGVAWFIVAGDAHGNRDTSSTLSIPILYYSGTFASNMSGSAFSSGFPFNKWRLISFPSDVDDKSVTATIRGALESSPSDETWNLFRYVGPGPDDYETTSTLRLGESYFLKQILSEQPVHVTLGAGQSVDLTGYTWTLPSQRWRFIASPYPFPVNVSADQGIFIGPWTYGEFGSSGQEGWSTGQVQTTFRPWGGYIIYNNTAQTQTLEIKPPGISKALLAKEAASLPDGWLMQLSVEGDRYYDGGNLIGRLAGALEARDSFDHPEPPLLDQCIALTMQRSDWTAGTALFTTDIRSMEALNGTWDLDLHTRGETGPIAITGELQGRLPPDLQVVLLDIARRQVCDLTAGEQPLPITDYTANLPYHLKIFAGTPEYVQGAVSEALAQLPEEFALSQNYPNPFNPSTTIEYALPVPAKVSLRVYNLLGQEITRLVDSWQDLGYHETIWHGRDHFGRDVASGVYFLVLHSPNRTLTRKMLLVR